MSDWYYAEGNQQRRGPLPETDLAELFRSGRIGLDTWVWREGLPQWRPLSEFARELSLSVAAAPPPLPLPPTMPGQAAAPAPATPKRGLSGCMIALIIVAACSVPAIAILAAIALPAYQDYTLRAKVAGALTEAAPLKVAAAEFRARDGRCPDNGDAGFGPAESYATAQVASIRLGEFEDGKCGMELRLRGTGSDRLDGKAVWFELDANAGRWTCTSEIENRYLPQACRG